MKIIVLGAGIMGVSTAWHLLELGHEVTVVERQSDAAMETSFANNIVGASYTASDESGDARVFTQKLAQRCIARGAEFLYGHDIVQLKNINNTIESVAIRSNNMGG